MVKKITFLLSIICSGYAAQSQTLSPTSELYNAPYDTLIAKGDKGYSSGKILGVKSPALAMMFYNRAAEIDPQRADAFSKKGTAYMEYRMLDEAVESFSSCLEVSPDNPQCLYGMFYSSFLGSTKYNMTEVPKPMMNQIYNSAFAFLAVAPAGMETEKLNAKILGNTFKLAIDNLDVFKKYNSNDVDNATPENIKALEEVITPMMELKNTMMAATTYDKVISYYVNKKDYAKVKELAPKAIATGDAFTSTYYYYAYALFKSDNNTVEAEKICDAGLKVGKNESISNLKREMEYAEGKKAYLVKDYAKTIAQFSMYNATNPDNERANAYLGFAQYALKKYPDAAKSLKVLKKNAFAETAKIYYPNLDALIAFAEKPLATPAPAIQTTLIEAENQEDIIEKAIALYEQEKYDESTAMLNEPLAYYEKTKNQVGLSYVFMNIAFNYHNAKNYEKAKEFYKKSIEQGGSESNSYNNLGLLLYAVDKNFTDAEKVLRDGLARHQDSQSIQNRIGKMFTAKADAAFEQKNYTDAAADYEKALTYYNDAEVFVFLGFSYYYLQDNAKCLEAIENAVYMNPNIGDTYPAVNQLLSSLK
jgi:tetratricopeptide (TPR) repeat protein